MAKSSNTSKAKAHKVGDVIDVPADVEFIQTPDGSVATVRSGGTYRLSTPGTHILGKASITVEK